MHCRLRILVLVAVHIQHRLPGRQSGKTHVHVHFVGRCPVTIHGLCHQTEVKTRSAAVFDSFEQNRAFP